MKDQLQKLLKELVRSDTSKTSTYTDEVLRTVKQAASPDFYNRGEFHRWVNEKWDQGFGFAPGSPRDLRKFEKQLQKSLERETDPITDEDLAQRRKMREEALKEVREREEQRSRSMRIVTNKVSSALERAFAGRVEVLDDEFGSDQEITMVMKHASKLDVLFKMTLRDKSLVFQTRLRPTRYVRETGGKIPSSFMRRVNETEKIPFKTAEEFDKAIKSAPSIAKRLVGNALVAIEEVYHG